MNEAYRTQAQALDAEILRCISERRVPDFNDLALRIFAHQLRFNAPYARYCAAQGVTLERLPASWAAIPPAPAGAFKEAALCTFDSSQAALTFRTSGTTAANSGTHFMENAALYDAALLAGFADAMLADAPPRLRYLLLVPHPQERADSSLGYMMRRVCETLGDGHAQWFLRGDALDADGFCTAARRAIEGGIAVCIAATAFALVQLLDALRAREIDSLSLAPGSRIMETGGFKGRTREVRREELYAQLCAVFSLPPERIVAEYGMTELTSQYYDSPCGSRTKRGPAWVRARVVGPDGATLPPGIPGALVHVDLANRSSCVAIRTQDVGIAGARDGFELIGREAHAQLRGCSLDAEALRA